MSVLDKLRDLVYSIESGDKEHPQEDLKSIIEEFSESDPEEEVIEELPSYIECTREETVSILEYREHAKRVKSQLADLLVNYENQKSALLQEIKKAQTGFYRDLNVLREKYLIPEDGYSVSVPISAEENIAFEKE